MDIFLRDIWPVDNLVDFKVHFARYNQVEEPLDRANFRFALLEHRAFHTTDQVILDREGFWKSILFTRGEAGLNRN